MNVQTIPSVQAAADSLLTRHPLLSQGYFAHLQAGKMERASFVNSQRQFYHAVTFFSRAMAALMARLPDSASRQVLMHNLAEEHGWDDEAFEIQWPPATLYGSGFEDSSQDWWVDSAEI